MLSAGDPSIPAGGLKIRDLEAGSPRLDDLDAERAERQKASELIPKMLHSGHPEEPGTKLPAKFIFTKMPIIKLFDRGALEKLLKAKGLEKAKELDAPKDDIPLRLKIKETPKKDLPPATVETPPITGGKVEDFCGTPPPKKDDSKVETPAPVTIDKRAEKFGGMTLPSKGDFAPYGK